METLDINEVPTKRFPTLTITAPDGVGCVWGYRNLPVRLVFSDLTSIDEVLARTWFIG